MKISQIALPELKLPAMTGMGETSMNTFAVAPTAAPGRGAGNDSVNLENQEAAESGLSQLPNFAAWDEGGTDGSGVDMRNGSAPIVTQFLQSPKNLMRALSSSATAASALGTSRSNLARTQNNPLQMMDSLAAVMGGVSLGGSGNGSTGMSGGLTSGFSALGQMGAGLFGGASTGMTGGSMGGMLGGRPGGSMNSLRNGASAADPLGASGAGERGTGSTDLDRTPTLVSGGASPTIVRASVSTSGESALTVKKDESGRQNLMSASSRHGQAQETAGKNALENMTAGQTLQDLSEQHGLAGNEFLQNAFGNMDAGQQNMDMAGMLGNQSQQAQDSSGLQMMIAEVMKAVQNVEKTKQAQAKAAEAQGKTTETQGKAIEASGQATDATGVTTQTNGVTTQATGVTLQATATSMLAAAAAAAGSVFGAPAGAALAAAGTAVMAQGTALHGMGLGLQGTGTALQAQGKAQQATGQATQAAGQQTQQVARTQHDQAKTAEEQAKKEEQQRQQMAKMLAEQAQKLMQQATQSVNQAVNNFANAMKSQELADKAREMRDEALEKAKDAFSTADEDKQQEQMAGANRKAVDEALKQAFGVEAGTQGSASPAAAVGAAAPALASANLGNGREAATVGAEAASPFGQGQNGLNSAMAKKPAAPMGHAQVASVSASTRPSDSRQRGASDQIGSSGSDGGRSNPLAAVQGMQNQGQGQGHGHGGSHNGEERQQRGERAPIAEAAPLQAAPSFGPQNPQNGANPRGGIASHGAESKTPGSAGLFGSPSGAQNGNGNSRMASFRGAAAPKKNELASMGGANGGANVSATPSNSGAGLAEEQNASARPTGGSDQGRSVAGFSQTDDSITVNLNDLGGSSSGSSNGSTSGGGSPKQSLDLGANAGLNLPGLDGPNTMGSSGFAGGNVKGAIPNGAGTASHKVSQQLTKG